MGLLRTGVILGVVIAFGGASAAYAASESVGGGTWQYGLQGKKPGGITYSNYYNGSKSHGSSAKSGKGLNRSPMVGKGKWSYAAIESTLTGNQAYWRNE
ncbi:lactococcin 972 family bacteriocin [Frondihabitans australicus]|nr:lactococcin 972 family bacteriocin [Frondihabitans australicus]